MKKFGVPARVVGVLCALVTGVVGAGLVAASPAAASPGGVSPSGGSTQVISSTTAELPTPVLTLTGLSLRTSGGTTFIQANLSVSNYAEYPDELFAPAPDLPPCGLNTNSSRTWVDIYNGQTNQRVYGFCALRQSKDLTGLWFARSITVGLPASVYIRLDDRRTGISYQSNTVSIS